MKANYLIGMALVSTVIFSACQSSNQKNLETKDIQGVYVGTLPCADCGGIVTALKLNADTTYLLQTLYKDKDDKVFETSGSYSIDAKKGEISLDGITNSPSKYLYENNSLTQLDMNGKKVTGNLAPNYILNKKDFQELTNRYWKLVEFQGAPVTNEKTFIIVDTKEGRVHGNSGCNDYSGVYELDEAVKRIRVSKVVATQKMCLDMGHEAAFLEMLEHIDNYSLNGERMTLNRARMAPLAVFEAVYVK